jgi:DNA-binding NarL/FixJ family response regulator
LAEASQTGRAFSLENLIELAQSGSLAPSEDSGIAGSESEEPQYPIPVIALTARETQVLELLVEGRTNPEIANQLYISPRTVSVHVTHILEKLGVENRSAAVALALRSGLITPSN